MQSYKRAVRVGELIQRELSKIVQEMKNPGVGFITLMHVTLTDDLQTARAFYSVIGTDEEIGQAAEVLKQATRDIRHQLALRLNLRRTPTLEFVFDDTPAKASHVFELLDRIKAEESSDENPEELPDEKDQ